MRFLLSWFLFVAFTVLPAAGGITSEKWGFFAHRLINRQAVFAIPAPLFGFYKEHINFLSEHAVDADKRRYSDPAEACRHYLDVDHYESAAPIDTIPHYWKAAIEKYTEDTLKAYGIVPWHINIMAIRLTSAFEKKNVPLILRLSADIGHYIADCHVPLHATKNYNGQLTGQEGIHAFWESRIPELFSGNYDFFTGKALHLDNIQNLAWFVLEQSFAAKDSVLLFEKELSERFGEDRKYSFEQRGNSIVKQYSKEFSTEYSNLLGAQVERRLLGSIKMVADVWYTCWINAGMPDLEGMKVSEPSLEEKMELSEQERKFLEGGILGRQEPH